MAGDQYQDTEDGVTLPATPSDWSISKALQNYASRQVPDWSPENSSLNMLLDKNEIRDIAGNATGNSVPPPQANGNIYTGLQPYVPDPHGPIGAGINGNGYNPQPGDAGILARLIMAESASTPQDMPALGWAVVNRVGNPESARPWTMWRIKGMRFNLFKTIVHCGRDRPIRKALPDRMPKPGSNPRLRHRVF